MFKIPPHFDSDFLKVIRFCWKFALWVIWWCWIYFWCYFDPKNCLWPPTGGAFWPPQMSKLSYDSDFIKVVGFGWKIAVWVIWWCWFQFLFIFYLFSLFFFYFLQLSFEIVCRCFLCFFILPLPRNLSIARFFL